MRFAALLTLLALIPFSPTQMPAQDLEKKLLGLNAADWRTAFSEGLSVADADPKAGLAAMKAAWPKITNVEARQQLMKAFYYAVPFPLHKRNHPFILPVLNLGATDPAAGVQQFAFEFIKQMSLQDFTKDPQGYAKWFSANGARPPEEVERDARVGIIKSAAKSAPAEREALADRLERSGIERSFDATDPEIALAIRESGLLKQIEGWLEAPDLSPKTMKLARILFEVIKPDNRYLERIIRPLLEKPALAPEVRGEMLEVIRRKAYSWAVDPLLDALVRSVVSGSGEEKTGVMNLAGALSEIGDPRVIPTMIAAIQFDDTYDTVYGIGYFGLSKMTGVRYSKRHDGAWWGKWWDRFKTKFPPDVQARKIPDLRPPDDFAAAEAARSDPRVAWLKSNATRIRSIDPNDEDFTDLMPLAKQIGNARIVQLGEQSHGDGATFVAKCRLIRFLHEKMGFDVLAWESGVFDCAQMERALRSSASLPEAIGQGIFPIWGDSPYVTPVFQYARETYSTPRPLEMAGFDCQFSTPESGQRFEAELGIFLNKCPEAIAEAEKQKAIVSRLANEIQGDYKPDPAKRKEYRAAVEAILGVIEKHNAALGKAAGAREVAWMRQVLRTLLVYEETRANPGAGKAEDNNIRDRAMAENLLWLANERYPGKKIVVWAASMHVAHGLSSVKTNEPGLSYAQLVNMGQGVHNALKDQVYTIGFTAYEGRAGNPFSGGHALARAGAGSLEACFHFAGAPISYVDFRELPAGHWLRKPQKSRPLGYSPMEAIWPYVFDGMFYTERMFPAVGDGTLPKMYRTAVAKKTVMEKEVGPLIEDIRRTAWDWGLQFDEALSQTPAGYDPKRVDREMEGEWPEMLGFYSDQMTDTSLYKPLLGSGKGYSPQTMGGYLVHEPLDAMLVPVNYQALLLAGGVAKTGGVDSKTYTTVYSAGEMAGTVRLKSYATAIVKGNLSGSLSIGSYFTGVVTGDLSGRFEADGAGALYVKGRLTGTADLSAGERKQGIFKLWIGGRTTRKDLERIQGPGRVWLADSDLPVGTQQIGELSVTVEKK